MSRYRAATIDDRVFIRSVWSSSYKNAHTAGMIASEDWPAVMHPTIDKLLDREGTRAIVAVDVEADKLVGFIAGNTSGPVPVVFYVYVTSPDRSMPTSATRPRSGPRYARGLFRALGVDPMQHFIYTAKTAVVTRIRDAGKIPRARFVPAAARYANYTDHQNEDE